MNNIKSVEDFKKLLSDEERQIILDMFEKVTEKYNRRATQAEAADGLNSNNLYYNYGVTDGINHCYKMISGIEDDYLEGVDFDD